PGSRTAPLTAAPAGAGRQNPAPAARRRLTEPGRRQGPEEDDGAWKTPCSGSIYRPGGGAPEVAGTGVAPARTLAMTGTAPAQLSTISSKRAAMGFMPARWPRPPRRMLDDRVFTYRSTKWLFPQAFAK